MMFVGKWSNSFNPTKGLTSKHSRKLLSVLNKENLSFLIKTIIITYIDSLI